MSTTCTRLRTRDGASSRCGDCAGCVQRREELYRMFEGGESYDRIVEVTGLHRSIVRAYRERWRMVRKLKAKRERSEGSEQDRYVERPMCACGLSLDETHTAETCDMATREHRSTGTGQWGVAVTDLQAERLIAAVEQVILTLAEIRLDNRRACLAQVELWTGRHGVTEADLSLIERVRAAWLRAAGEGAGEP